MLFSVDTFSYLVRGLISRRHHQKLTHLGSGTLRLPVFEKPAKSMQVSISSQLAHTRSAVWHHLIGFCDGASLYETVSFVFIYLNTGIRQLPVQAIIYCPDRKDKQKKKQAPNKEKRFLFTFTTFLFFSPKSAHVHKLLLQLRSLFDATSLRSLRLLRVQSPIACNIRVL